VSTKKIGMYTDVYNKYTLLYTSTGGCIRVYTSPGRWGAHYTTVHYPPGKKIGSVYGVCTLLDYTSPVLVRDVALSAIRTHHQTTPAQRGRSIVLLQANTRNINPPSVRSPQQREVLLWPFIQTKKYYTFPLSPPLRTYSVQCTVHLFPRAKFIPVLCGGVYIAKRLEGKKEYHRDHSSTNLP
jgi:hypothetical protein